MNSSLFNPDDAALVEAFRGKHRYTDAQLADLAQGTEQAREYLAHSMQPGFESLPPVTVWFRWNAEARRFELNHLEDGHVPAAQERPTPQCKIHESLWARGRWKALPARLMATNRRLRGPRVLYCDPVEAEIVKTPVPEEATDKER